MAEVIMTKKQTRVRCNDEQFLEAVYSSKTYTEIAEKTGQKIASTIARYARVKKVLNEQGVDLPEIVKQKTNKTVTNTKNMVEIAKRLKAHHSNI